ncbi:hypothetical protein TcasGA2_TC000772 [Tribolium castaneum]|uniref:Uncharacterized protein n=1 Tax=Tribolium castaneum TaxID=7070 RepID=D6WD44_TRICA|nr:hypothetical protein TcasGA2_TC000772 [Tribolium castaneum]
MVNVLDGIYTVTKMDGYTTVDKFKALFKRAHPILQFTWMQWKSKAKQNERALENTGEREKSKSESNE